VETPTRTLPAVDTGSDGRQAWEGDDYQARFDRLAASGADVHGEATFVRAYEPLSVLDAGCGTGRVAIELARHGIEVVGVDADASMLATAARRAPELTWVEADLTSLDLGRSFDVVVLAGNVPLFTPSGTQAALVAGVARHVAPGGWLIAGFSLDRGYGLARWDADADAADLRLVERFATWDRAPWVEGGLYAVSVHRPRP
jgi:SAM-dependent methyltransferase